MKSLNAEVKGLMKSSYPEENWSTFLDMSPLHGMEGRLVACRCASQ